MKCIVIEDEISAQEVLKEYVSRTPFLTIEGIFESGTDVSENELRDADLLFLDVQTPAIDGISFLRTLTIKPNVIITTAYPDFAVNAFEEAVIDYLVKPFSFERFFKAVNRVRVRNNQTKANNLEEILYLYADKTIYKLNTNDILFLKAEVDYVRFVTDKQQLLILDSLKNWEEKLAHFGFIRVHRSFAINVSKIRKVTGNLIHIGQERIPIGNTYKQDLMNLLGF